MTRADDPGVEWHPQARDEAAEALRWYRERDRKVARQFLEAIDHAVQRAADDPARWPKYASGTRRYLLRRFPYSLIYREQDEVIQVVALAHNRRRPRYWAMRVSDEDMTR